VTPRDGITRAITTNGKYLKINSTRRNEPNMECEKQRDALGEVLVRDEFAESLDGQPLIVDARHNPYPPIAAQLHAAIDMPGCVSPLRGCCWWVRSGKLQTRRQRRK
jgi:hypothetical protein